MQGTNGAVRAAVPEDAPAISRLSALLGYPVSVASVAARLDALLTREDRLIAVHAAPRRLLGLMEVEHRLTLELGDRAEIITLVVDDAARGRGVGRQLVHHGEDWAQRRGLETVTVRSNAARTSSHGFYAALGYRHVKTQHVYTRALGAGGGVD